MQVAHSAPAEPALGSTEARKIVDLERTKHKIWAFQALLADATALVEEARRVVHTYHGPSTGASAEELDERSPEAACGGSTCSFDAGSSTTASTATQLEEHRRREWRDSAEGPVQATLSVEWVRRGHDEPSIVSTDTEVDAFIETARAENHEMKEPPPTAYPTPSLVAAAAAAATLHGLGPGLSPSREGGLRLAACPRRQRNYSPLVLLTAAKPAMQQVPPQPSQFAPASPLQRKLASVPPRRQRSYSPPVLLTAQPALQQVPPHPSQFSPASLAFTPGRVCTTPPQAKVCAAAATPAAQEAQTPAEKPKPRSMAVSGRGSRRLFFGQEKPPSSGCEQQSPVAQVPKRGRPPPRGGRLHAPERGRPIQPHARCPQAASPQVAAPVAVAPATATGPDEKGMLPESTAASAMMVQQPYEHQQQQQAQLQPQLQPQLQQQLQVQEQPPSQCEQQAQTQLQLHLTEQHAVETAQQPRLQGSWVASTPPLGPWVPATPTRRVPRSFAPALPYSWAPPPLAQINRASVGAPRSVSGSYAPTPGRSSASALAPANAPQGGGRKSSSYTPPVPTHSAATAVGLTPKSPTLVAAPVPAFRSGSPAAFCAAAHRTSVMPCVLRCDLAGSPSSPFLSSCGGGFAQVRSPARVCRSLAAVQ